MDAELAGEISLAGLGFDHGAIKFQLCGYDGRQRDEPLAPAGCRWSGNFLTGGNAPLQRRGDRIGRADERIGRILTESGDFRKIRSGHEDRSVIVSCELYGRSEEHTSELQSPVHL